MANEKFKINGVVSEVVPTIGTTGDILKKTVSGVEWGSLDKATQAEAEAGTNDTKIMTPLRVKQVTEQYATKAELANIDLTEELENLATKAELENKVDKVSGKQLSTNDYTTVDKNKLTGIETGAQKNNVTSTDIANWNNKVDKVSGKQLSTNDYTATDKNKLAGIETGAQKNNVTSTDIANWNNKVDKVSGKQLSTNDYTATEKNKLAGIEAGAQKNIMTSADKTKLDGVETGAQKNNVTSTDIANWNNKVDKVSGKQLSTNDYTTAEKNKLEGIQTGAQVNAVTSVNGQTGAVTTPNTTYDVVTTTTDGLMSSADKVKLNGVETGAQKNTITSVQGRTGAVTVSKSDVGLGSVNNVAITAAQVTKINELNYTRAMTEAQYNALTTTEKNRTDVWYGIY